jgi:hypothetical protein
MNAEVRRRIEMAERARDFSRANPFQDPTSATVVGRLEELVTRANALANQESAGRITRHAATVRRADLRRELVSHFLRPVVRAAELASRQRPDMLGKFRLPSTSANSKAFFMAARNMVTAAVADRELFASLGISDTVLEDLGRAVNEFEQATEAAHTGRSKHVGARADLKQVTADIMDLIGVVDGLNRHRFREDKEKLAAWDSERNVIGPLRPKPAETPAGGEVASVPALAGPLEGGATKAA